MVGKNCRHRAGASSGQLVRPVRSPKETFASTWTLFPAATTDVTKIARRRAEASEAWRSHGDAKGPKRPKRYQCCEPELVHELENHNHGQII